MSHFVYVWIVLCSSCSETRWEEQASRAEEPWRGGARTKQRIPSSRGTNRLEMADPGGAGASPPGGGKVPPFRRGGGVDFPARRGPRSGGVRILPRSGEARSGRLSREAEAAGSLDILQPILESNLHNTSNKAGPPDPTCIWTRSCKKLSFVLKPMKDLDLALKTK